MSNKITFLWWSWIDAGTSVERKYRFLHDNGADTHGQPYWESQDEGYTDCQPIFGIFKRYTGF